MLGKRRVFKDGIFSTLYRKSVSITVKSQRPIGKFNIKAVKIKKKNQTFHLNYRHPNLLCPKLELKGGKTLFWQENIYTTSIKRLKSTFFNTNK